MVRRGHQRGPPEILYTGPLPLVVLWVEVPFLHCCFLFGGLTFVRQQHEGDIAVHTILTLRCQTSVHRNRKHVYMKQKAIVCVLKGF